MSKDVNAEEIAAKAKEKKQMIILIGIVSAGVLYALVRFALMPLLNSGDQEAAEISDRESKLQAANRLMRKKPGIEKDLVGLNSEIRKVSALYLPPPEDALSWATGNLYQTAREVGMEIEWVEKVDRNLNNMLRKGPRRRSSKDKSDKPERKRAFNPFVVRVLTVCSYEKIQELINKLEANNPYICVSQLEIVAQAANPDKHRVTFVAEWPMWADSENMASLNSQSEGTNTSPEPQQANYPEETLAATKS